MFENSNIHRLSTHNQNKDIHIQDGINLAPNTDLDHHACRTEN